VKEGSRYGEDTNLHKAGSALVGSMNRPEWVLRLKNVRIFTPVKLLDALQGTLDLTA
jgi:hypothetical protein